MQLWVIIGGDDSMHIQAPSQQTSTGAHFEGVVPDVPSLTLVASVTEVGQATASATGIGATRAEAWMRHDAEQAERKALLRRWPDGLPKTQLTASAAGNDGRDHLRARALCELVERVLVQEWWSGARPAAAASEAALQGLQIGLRDWPRCVVRRTGLIEIEPCGVHVAWSCDSSGKAVCLGAACRPLPERAAKAALRELYQMEFGLALSQRRAAAGLVLSAGAAKQLARAERLDLREVLSGCTTPVSDTSPRLDPEEFLMAERLKWREIWLEGDMPVVVLQLPWTDAPSSRSWPFYVGS